MVFQDKLDATKGLVSDEKINHMRVLWQKGRNMFQSFMTEAEAIKKQINDDELFAAWCLWQLHISITPITEASAFLKKDDADRVKTEFASASKADKDARAAEAHKLKLEKIAKQNEIVMAQLQVAEQKAALRTMTEPEKKVEPEPKQKKKSIPLNERFELTEEQKAHKAKAAVDKANGIDREIRAREAWLAFPDLGKEAIRYISHSDGGIVWAARHALEKEGKLAPVSLGRPPRIKSETTRFAALVKEGVKAANHQWTLGDLAIEVTTLKVHGAATLEHYAEAIGVELKALQNYRWVAEIWLEKSTRVDNWTVCRTLATHPDRVAIVTAKPDMTVVQAREIMKSYNVVPIRSA